MGYILEGLSSKIMSVSLVVLQKMSNGMRYDKSPIIILHSTMFILNFELYVMV